MCAALHAYCLETKGFVQRVEGLVVAFKTIQQLSLRNNERWGNVEMWGSQQTNQSVFAVRLLHKKEG